MTILFRYLKFNRLNSVLIAASISMIIEIFQLFTGWGGFDISDWILNVLGALLGIGIFELYSKLSYKVQYIIIAIFGIVTIPVDIYAIINTILNFPN